MALWHFVFLDGMKKHYSQQILDVEKEVLVKIPDKFSKMLPINKNKIFINFINFIKINFSNELFIN